MTQQLRTTANTPSPGRVTYEEFLSLDGENQHVEWVNGEVVAMAPVSTEHQLIARFLVSILSAYVEVRELGETLFDPFQMKTGPDLPGRAPDLLFIAKENLGRLKTNYLEGPADLIVEVISPGRQDIDKTDKYAEYEQGGVHEYWLIDPIRKDAKFFQLSAGKNFQEVPGTAGIYNGLMIPGLWIDVRWLWKRPTIISVLKQWKLV